MPDKDVQVEIAKIVTGLVTDSLVKIMPLISSQGGLGQVGFPSYDCKGKSFSCDDVYICDNNNHGCSNDFGCGGDFSCTGGPFGIVIIE